MVAAVAWSGPLLTTLMVSVTFCPSRTAPGVAVTLVTARSVSGTETTVEANAVLFDVFGSTLVEAMLAVFVAVPTAFAPACATTVSVAVAPGARVPRLTEIVLPEIVATPAEAITPFRMDDSCRWARRP